MYFLFSHTITRNVELNFIYSQLFIPSLAVLFRINSSHLASQLSCYSTTPISQRSCVRILHNPEFFSSCCCFASSVCKSSVHSRLGLQHRGTYGWRPNLRSQLRHFTCSLLYFPYSILSHDCNIAIHSFDYALFLRLDVPHVASKWDRPDWERIEEPESAPK